MNQKGSALIVVMIIVAALLYIATFLFESGVATRKQRQAQSVYAVTSVRAENAARIAAIWLESLDAPPEWDAAHVSGCTQCYAQVTDKSESDLLSVKSTDFFAFDENNDGSVTDTDQAWYLIVPLGNSAAGSCVANDGYSAACWRTHSYLIVSRAREGIRSEVERKQEFKRQFYY